MKERKTLCLGDIVLITPFIPLKIRGMKKPLIFERELAGKTELLRFWKSQTVKPVK
jgi:hypothetical protein